MTWVKFDDGYRTNRKVAALSDAAYRLDSESIMWSNSETCDGVVRSHELTQIRRRATPRVVAELVAVGRWHLAGTSCESERCPANPASPSPASALDGWVIHDYFDFQPTRAKVVAARAARAERQRNWMATRRGSRHTSDSTTDSTTDSTSDRATDPPTDSTSDGVSRRVTGMGADTHPYPYPPPAPEGKRGGDLPEAPPARRDAAGRADGWREDQNPVANGHAPVRPPDSSALRATLAAAARNARRPSAGGAFEALRDATPEVAVLVEDAPELIDPEIQGDQP